MTATRTVPAPYRSGLCSTSLHERCRGAYSTAICDCGCHQEPGEPEPEPEPPPTLHDLVVAVLHVVQRDDQATPADLASCAQTLIDLISQEAQR